MCFPTLSVKRLDFSGWREVRLRSVTHAFSVIQMHKARFTNVCIDVCVAFENTQAGASVHAISKQFYHTRNCFTNAHIHIWINIEWILISCSQFLCIQMSETLQTSSYSRMAWHAQITSHGHVGFWDKFQAAGFAYIQKCKLHSTTSVPFSCIFPTKVAISSK